METIYLVGQISPKFSESYQWRKDIITKLSPSDFKVIDPCSNGFNQDVLKRKEYAIKYGKREFGIDVLPSKDLTYVLKSDIAVVNLTQYDPNKELLGSYYEMAWLYLHQEKTVIAFSEDLNSYNCQRPFVKMTVDTWCRNVDEACYILERYFKEPTPESLVERSR